MTLQAPSALFTDLYELTMAAAYHDAGLDETVSFELSVRELPPQRRFLVVAGLESALAGLESFGFTAADLAYLAGLGMFPAGFLDHLADLRFTGDVVAMPEGEVVFATEPLLRVTAPLIEAQLVETFLLNQIASQTMVASKAARVALACGSREFVDFSARRDHGTEAALAAARGAWIAGASGTSLVAAGARWDLPLSGTMAHSYVLAFPDERDAFRAYARAFPERCVLLVDTYDTLTGVSNAIEVAGELRAQGIEVAAVRLDSGDLAALAGTARRMLDDAGFSGIRIVASGDLDENRIATMLGAGAPIDVFGVGTQLGTSGDAASLGAVYKLVEDRTGPRMKRSEGKLSLPGRKQVWRGPENDVVALEDEPVSGHRPLLVPVMRGGRRCAPEAGDLTAARDRCRHALATLPEPVRSLAPADGPVWPVRLSHGLDRLVERLMANGPGPASLAAR